MILHGRNDKNWFLPRNVSSPKKPEEAKNFQISHADNLNVLLKDEKFYCYGYFNDIQAHCFLQLFCDITLFAQKQSILSWTVFNKFTKFW